MLRAASLVVGLSFAGVLCGCSQEASDLRAVEKTLRKGPEAACCHFGLREPEMQKCHDEVEAGRRCAFIRGFKKIESATFVTHCAGACTQMDVVTTGSNGRGQCHFQVWHDGIVEPGGCHAL
jgi:hypothetical protein